MFPDTGASTILEISICTDPGSYKFTIRMKRKRTKNARYTKRTHDTRNERTIHETNARYMKQMHETNKRYVNIFLPHNIYSYQKEYYNSKHSTVKILCNFSSLSIIFYPY